MINNMNQPVKNGNMSTVVSTNESNTSSDSINKFNVIPEERCKNIF